MYRTQHLRPTSSAAETLLRLHVATLVALHGARTHISRRSREDRQAGVVSVETIGWIGIAVVVVAAVGLIVRTKLTAMANSLPETFGW